MRLFHPIHTLCICLLKLLVVGSIALLLNGCLGGSGSCKDGEALDTMTNKCVKKDDSNAADSLPGNPGLQAAADVQFSLAPFSSDAEIVRITDTATLDDHLIHHIDGNLMFGEICPNYPNYKTVHVGIKPGATVNLYVRSLFESKLFNHYNFSLSYEEIPQQASPPPLNWQLGDFQLTQVVPWLMNNFPRWNRGPSNHTWLTITAPTLPQGIDYYTYRFNVEGAVLAYEWTNNEYETVYTLLVHVLRPIEEPLHIVRLNAWDEMTQQYILPNRFPELYNGQLGNGLNEIWNSALVHFRPQYHVVNSHYDLDHNLMLNLNGNDQQTSLEFETVFRELSEQGITGNVVLVVNQIAEEYELGSPLWPAETEISFRNMTCDRIRKSINFKRSLFLYDRVAGTEDEIQFPDSPQCDDAYDPELHLPVAFIQILPAERNYLYESGSKIFDKTAAGIAPFGYRDIVLISESMFHDKQNPHASFISTIAHEIGHSFFKLFHTYDNWAGVQATDPPISRRGLMHPYVHSQDPLSAYVGNRCTPLKVSSDRIATEHNKPPAERLLETLMYGQNGQPPELIGYQQPWFHIRHNRHLPWQVDAY